jgi:UDP-3-O-acyl N-acetylglucosamine deacetylase
VSPAAPGSGLRLQSGGVTIPIDAARRVPAARRTALSVDGARVDTVEHLLAAVSALGYDDLDLQVEGGEIPIGDGSFQPFVALLEEAGSRDDAGSKRVARIERELRLALGDAQYVVAPAETLLLDVTLEYPQPVIGRQRCLASLAEFGEGIARARTFGFVSDIQRAQQHGELLGATTEAGIALEADRVVNTTLRWPDEPVRHKLGDLFGDLVLVGAPVRARITAIRPSHDGNFACVRAILDAARFLEE